MVSHSWWKEEGALERLGVLRVRALLSRRRDGRFLVVAVRPGCMPESLPYCRGSLSPARKRGWRRCALPAAADTACRACMCYPPPRARAHVQFGKPLVSQVTTKLEANKKTTKSAKTCVGAPARTPLKLAPGVRSAAARAPLRAYSLGCASARGCASA